MTRASMPSAKLQKQYRVAVMKAFGAEWLSAPAGLNVVQQLWQRSDHLASVEILTLGHALVNLRRKHSTWLAGVVKEAKCGDRGKLFEAICLSMFESGNGTIVSPASANEPGFDAKITVRGQHPTFLLSIKNHDLSSKEKDFRTECRALRTLHRTVATKLGCSFQTFITANDHYLLSSDWRRIEQCFVSESFNVNSHFVLENNVCVDVMPLHSDAINQGLSSEFISDILIVSGKYSPNEQKGFVDKIEEASLKFSKIAGSTEQVIPRVAFIRLHATANFPRMVEYARQRMTDGDLPFHLNGLWLYQSAPIRDSSTDPYANTEILHHICPINSSKFSLTSYRGKLCVPIGKVFTSYAYNALNVNGRVFKMTEHYLFQSGDLYIDHGLTPNRPNNVVTVGSPASGIRTHLVLPDHTIAITDTAAEEDFLVI